MKTKFFKMVLPALTLMLAVFGAFAFKTVDSKALLAPESAWINLPGQPCAVEVQCDNTPGLTCTAIYQGTTHQAFGKVNPSQMICNKVLYRPQ
ncbi:MAG: DUF6520 family protein [Flavobacterium sp.]